MSHSHPYPRPLTSPEPSAETFMPGNYRERWIKRFAIDSINDSKGAHQWAEFHRYWWGQNSRGHADLTKALESTDLNERIIRVPQVKVQNALGLLTHSKGGMLLRQDYTDLYDQLSNLSGFHSFVLVSGQPGIGKTYFALFALLRRMVEGRRVLFSNATGHTFLFDESGVISMKKDNVEDYDLPNDDGSPDAYRVWSLVDAERGKSEGATGLANTGVFSVLVSSPQESQYKYWYKDTCAVKLVAQPWSVEELHFMLSDAADLTLQPQSKRAPHQTLESMEKVVSAIGPCPRDIYNYVNNPASVETAIVDALNAVKSGRQLADMLVKAESTMDSISEELLLIRRGCDGRPVVDFKSRHIGLNLVERFFINSDCALSL